MLKLNLSYKGKLDPEITVLFNNISKQLRGPFTDIVSRLSEPIKSDINWWVEGPSSRNTLVSPFFHYYCTLNLIDELIKKNYDISEILVDSFAFKKILKEYFHTTGKSILIKYNGNRLISYFKQLIIPFVKIPIELYRRIYQYQCSQKTKHLQKPIRNKPLTLIDVFAFTGFISKDRYYNGLWDSLNNEQKESTFFVPTLVMIPLKKMVSSYKELRTADRNFLIKEDYLKLSDILFAVGHYFKLFKIKIRPTLVLGIDISSLVNEELSSMRGYTSAVESLLNYRFAKRIKEQKLNLRLVIDWFENQVVDKGWNAGFKEFYPDIPTVGYRGFISISQYLCSYPSEIEDNSGILPSRIAVTGKGLIDSTKEFATNLTIESSPAFRYQHVWDNTKIETDSYYFTILVALSIVNEESINVLQLIKNYLKSSDSNNLRFWIKSHPAVKNEKLKEQFVDWPDDFNCVTGDFSKIIVKSDLMISNASSTCMEALACGIPVIVVENIYGLSYNTVPDEIPQVLWRSCRTTDDIKNAIKHYQYRSNAEIDTHNEIGMEIKKLYFTPVTKKNVRKFLLMDSPIHTYS